MAAQLHDALLMASVAAALLAVIAFILLRKRRVLAIGVAVALVVSGVGMAGVGVWMERQVGAGRLAVGRAMRQRPHDLWPDATAHIPLGALRAEALQKGYLEPAGAFSPAVGSFGVTFWIKTADGSYRLAAGPLSQRYVPGGPPAIETVTPDYVARWTIARLGRSELDIAPRAAISLEMVVRAVGPAGGPVRRIERVDATALRINGRWEIRGDTLLDIAYLGREAKGWLTSDQVASVARDSSGWAAVRLRVSGARRFAIRDLKQPELKAQPWPMGGSLDLPGADREFDASFRAQVDTLRQSVMGRALPPGDPVNYPFPWLRDGAYSLVALARSDPSAPLRDLARPFAANDFFGGFGAEADGPGLALWALGEASAAVADPAFDAEIWPGVRRKAELILRLRRATSNVEADYTGPIVPRYRSSPELRLVAEPSRGELIWGRMDWERPVFYVNAVSYRGLRSAAAMAARLGHQAEALRWQSEAESLRLSWLRAYGSPTFAAEARDDRTIIASLWPSEVAEPQVMKPRLQSRWRASHTEDGRGFNAPRLWTYFDLAEAHQWLRAKEPDAAWSTLRWFWSRQPMPGLYTLWEGQGEENSLGIWRGVRGWTQPARVTPHYWAAAEMLLLQVEMLAYVRDDPGAPTLVIGAGVPAEWLKHGFKVGPIGTPAGVVRWRWDGRDLYVQAPRALRVELGPAFPAASAVHRLDRL